MKFKADYNGTVTGIRFYKAAANTGTHIGSLWTTDGTRLATATFTNETASGLADGDVRQPGLRHGRHDVRRVVLHADRPLLVHGQRLRVGRSTTGRCTRSPTA